MSAVAFDTLKVARALRTEAMMSAEQAEGLSNVLAEAMSGAELATKSDVAAVRTELAAAKAELKNDIAAVKAELKADIAVVETKVTAVHTELKADLREMELRMTIKLGAMLAAGIAIVATVVKLIH